MKIIDTDIKMEYEIDLEPDDLINGMDNILRRLDINKNEYEIKYSFSMYVPGNGGYLNNMILVSESTPLRVRITCTK